MKFIINKDKLTVDDKEVSFNSGSIDYYEAEVEFDESWDNLIKEAVVTEREGQSYADDGISIPVSPQGKVFIDRELSGEYGIGFQGYTLSFKETEDTAIDSEKTYYTRSGEEGSYIYTKVENPDVESINTYYEAIKDYQISTQFFPKYFAKGAGEVKTQNQGLPKTTQWEAYVTQVHNTLEAMQIVVDEADTIDFDISKEGKITSIVLTKKDGSTKTVQVLDGEKGDKGDTYTITAADYASIATIVKNDIVIPQKTSDLTNDSGFITNIVNNLMNYYLKSETYTKEEVNNLIGQIPSIQLVKVNVLPQTGTTGIIYLVPNQSQEQRNIFDEFIWIDNDWEKIGDTQIDLTGYATETWVTGQISNFATFSDVSSAISTALLNYYTQSQVDSLLSNKANNSTLADYVQKTNFLTGSSAPTENTIAPFVGALYLDTTNNKTYECTSITSDGGEPANYTYTWVKIIRESDYARYKSAGLVEILVGGGYGIDYLYSTVTNPGGNSLKVCKASNNEIDAKTNNYKAIVPSNLNYAVRSVQPAVTSVASPSSTQSLSDNTIYDMTISSNITFSLPSISDTTIFHMIEIRATISNSPTINLGTTYYLGDEPELGNGDWIIYYEYINGHWRVGTIEGVSGV